MSKKSIALLSLAVANFIWALDYPLYKIIMPHYISPLAMVTMAIVVAAVFTIAISFFAGWERVDKADIPMLVGAAFLVAIMRKVFLMEGISRTSPIDGSIIDSVAPVIVLIIAVMMHMERFSPRKVVGLILGMGGAIAVVVFGTLQSHASSDLTGNVLVFLCAVASAIYLVWFKKIVMKYKPLTILRWVYCIGTVMILPFGTKEVLHVDFASFSNEAWLAFLFVLLIPTLGPNLMLANALRTVQPTVSSMFSYIQPVVATALAVAMGMDKLHWETVIAAVVIFAGVYLVIASYKTDSQSERIHLRGIK